MAAQAPLPIQFKKMYAAPINPDSVFETLEAAQAYATGPLGAAGEILSVKDAESGKYSAYVINEDKSLNSLGGDVSGIWDALHWQEL